MVENKPFAFVLMPFDVSFDDIYKLGIQAIADENGIIAQRIDEQKFSETMLERIYRQIDQADFIIADMTGKNANVFYEVGYAHAKEKLCTLLTQDASDIPFDLKHHRHIVYGNSIRSLKEQLSPELVWLKEEVIRLKTVPIQIEENNIWGYIEKVSYKAEAEVTCTFDFRNKTKKRSPEIESIYFYTGEGWEFNQDGQVCPSTKSDILKHPPLRHFIKSQVSRLSPGGWAQIKIIGKKTVWNEWSGEEYKDSYHLKGRVIMEVNTSDGIFTEQINMNVSVDEIPF